MTTADDINAYINWTLYVVLGGLREADSFMRQHRTGIRRVAGELSRRHPIAARPLYRGVLVNPALGVGAEYVSVSWSEDRDVARWFGSPESFISEPFRQMFPEARGYLLTLPAPTSRVLFHHSWARAFAHPLEALALRHPHMGVEGARQIQWSLRTQQEVITEPVAKLPEAQPVETVEGASVAALDERLSPPWKETIALAVAKDLGVKMHWKYHRDWSNGRNGRKCSDVCGFGRESAIQTWRYTCQYLWRTIDELAEAQIVSSQSVRAYRNAYRVGCSQRIAERIWLAAQERKTAPAAHVNDEPKNKTKAIAASAERQLSDRFGLSLDDFGALLAAQGGVCAICKQECTSKRRLSVDHDHVTGKVRGLLCMRCNVGVGHFKENPELLQAAADYLKTRKDNTP